MKELEPSEDKKLLPTQAKLSKKHYDFLTNYARTHNKQLSMREAGLHLKANGSEYNPIRLDEKANMILRNPEAQEFIKRLHDDIFTNACHQLERAIVEAYDIFIDMKQKGKYREMNIAYSTYLELCGFLTKNKSNVNVNTQIVTDGQSININYISPPPKKDNE